MACPIGPLDALKAAPEHHTLLLENDQVRVLNTLIRPGERTAIHTHCWPATLYILSWSDFIRYDAEGNVMRDSTAMDQTPELGTAVWSGPLGPHSLENIGTRDIQVIAVEMKVTD